MAKKDSEITEEHAKALLKVENGGTVWGARDAYMYREIQREHPKLITVIDNLSELEQILDQKFDGQTGLPYFGVHATDRGIKVAQTKLMVKKISGTNDN